jgi:hypothetical protein
MHLALIPIDIKQILDLIFIGEMTVDSLHLVITKGIMKIRAEL